MIDLGLFKIRTDVFILVLFLLVTVLQLYLCAHVKRLWVRLLPAIVCGGVAIVFLVLAFCFSGWDAVGFFLLALWTACLLAGCGIAWGVWAIAKKLNIKKH